MVICSKSTLKYAKEIGGRVHQVSEPPTKDVLETIVADDEIIAIGGGAVMDTAKILAANSGIKTVLCYPTTAAGAGNTSRAVYWDGTRKHSIVTPLPLTISCPEWSGHLPDEILRNTRCDAFAHMLESLWSKKATHISRLLAMRAFYELENGYSLVVAGNIAGMAIEITGTNVIHGASYPLTGHYGLCHGYAVGLMLPVMIKFMEYNPEHDLTIPECTIPLNIAFDIDMLATDAMSYPQLHTSIKSITESDMRILYKEALCKAK